VCIYSIVIHVHCGLGEHTQVLSDHVQAFAYEAQEKKAVASPVSVLGCNFFHKWILV
jgi:hypothetical protein